MRDPQCLVCSPKLCIHGEQSPSEDDLVAAAVRERLVLIQELAEQRMAELARVTAERDGALNELAAVRRERDVLRLERETLIRDKGDRDALEVRP